MPAPRRSSWSRYVRAPARRSDITIVRQLSDMATVNASHRLDLAAVKTLLTSRQGGAVHDMLRRGFLVETQAKRNLAGIGGPKRIDTGRLRASIATQVIGKGGRPIVVVGTNVRYARLVHDGTGIYGSRHQRIRPKAKKALRWKAPYGRRRGYAFAKSVEGMKPNPFLKNALRAARG